MTPFNLEEETRDVCEICGIKMPLQFYSPIFVSRIYHNFCPQCSLLFRNRYLGLPDNTPFQGELASQMYDDYIDYLIEEGLYVP